MRTYADLCVTYADLCGPMRTYADLCGPTPKKARFDHLVDIMRPELRPVRPVFQPSQFTCFPVHVRSDVVAGVKEVWVATKLVLEHLLTLNVLTHCVLHASAHAVHALIEVCLAISKHISGIEGHKVGHDFSAAAVRAVSIFLVKAAARSYAELCGPMRTYV